MASMATIGSNPQGNLTIPSLPNVNMLPGCTAMETKSPPAPPDRSPPNKKTIEELKSLLAHAKECSTKTPTGQTLVKYLMALKYFSDMNTDDLMATTQYDTNTIIDELMCTSPDDHNGCGSHAERAYNDLTSGGKYIQVGGDGTKGSVAPIPDENPVNFDFKNMTVEKDPNDVNNILINGTPVPLSAFTTPSGQSWQFLFSSQTAITFLLANLHHAPVSALVGTMIANALNIITISIVGMFVDKHPQTNPPTSKDLIKHDLGWLPFGLRMFEGDMSQLRSSVRVPLFCLEMATECVNNAVKYKNLGKVDQGFIPWIALIFAHLHNSLHGLVSMKFPSDFTTRITEEGICEIFTNWSTMTGFKPFLFGLFVRIPYHVTILSKGFIEKTKDVRHELDQIRKKMEELNVLEEVVPEPKNIGEVTRFQSITVGA